MLGLADLAPWNDANLEPRIENVCTGPALRNDHVRRVARRNLGLGCKPLSDAVDHFSIDNSLAVALANDIVFGGPTRVRYDCEKHVPLLRPPVVESNPLTV